MMGTKSKPSPTLLPLVQSPSLLVGVVYMVSVADHEDSVG